MTAAELEARVQELAEWLREERYHVSGAGVDGRRTDEVGAAFLLGRTPKTLRNARSLGDNRIPWLRIGGSVFYRLSDLARLLYPDT